MDQVAGHRGRLSPYSPIPTTRQSGRVIAGSFSPQKSAGVRFGGLQNAAAGSWQGFVNFSLPTFEKITEVFLWAFLAQDVVAMWLPRIYALLTEGRAKYDPKTDPNAKDLPFGKQVSKWVDGNLKGLNWGNFKEGTKREFATGPGLLMVPAFVFLLANKLANPSVTMPYPALKTMGAGLAEHLEGHSPEHYKTQLKDYISSIFADPDLKNHSWKVEGKADRKIADWANDWVEHLFKEYPSTEAKEKHSKKLTDELKTAIRDFNRKDRILPYEKEGSGVRSLMSDKNPLHRSESTWVAYERKVLDESLAKGDQTLAAQKLRQIPTAEVLSDLERMAGFARAVGEKATSGVTLAESARLSTEKLIKMKFGLAVGATVITAAYLTKLAFWAQNHGAYQATRLLNEKALNNQACKQPNKAARSPQAGIAPMTNAHCLVPAQPLNPVNPALAGSAYGLQPVFSVGASPATRFPLGLPVRQSGWGTHPLNGKPAVSNVQFGKNAKPELKNGVSHV